MYVVFYFFAKQKSQTFFHKGNDEFHQCLSGLVSWDYWKKELCDYLHIFLTLELGMISLGLRIWITSSLSWSGPLPLSHSLDLSSKVRWPKFKST